MKIFVILFSLLLFVMAMLYPFLDISDNGKPLTGLPWQIDILPDGNTQVFGISIGSSRLSDALAVLGDNMELAIVAASDETGSLEMYYDQYHAGLLSGKLILHTTTDEQIIRQWRDNAVKSEYMATGKSKKYSLSRQAYTQALEETVSGITFIPAVNLDEEVILARFGEPEQRLQAEGAVHFLYPAKGLDIALYPESKEVLQFVTPDAFRELTLPLQ